MAVALGLQGRAQCSCGRLWTDRAEFSYDSGKAVRQGLRGLGRAQCSWVADCGQTEQSSVMTVVRQSGMIGEVSEGSSSWSPGRRQCSCGRPDRQTEFSYDSGKTVRRAIERFSEGSSSWSPGRALRSCGRL
ncbi:hypothetical protein J6590_079561 [Homalodisca vitripennis]|nr:hypothetical protein J6590_079561 [Homalodisca vitripennis]